MKIKLNKFIMQYVKQRQNDPQYLKSVIAQRDIIVQQQKRKCDELSKQMNKLKHQYDELAKQKQHKEESLIKEINNLVKNLAIKEYDNEVEILKHEKSELQFMLNNTKLKLQEFQRQHKNEIEKLTMEFETQKELSFLKVSNLQRNLSELKKYYKVEEHIVDDKKKIIEDTNRDLRGFSNEKQERMLIIQNQQYKNQIEYQSKNLTIQLEKNEKLLEEIKSLKLEVQLHKEIQNDLVKRSSLAQTLIKKLYKEIQQSKKNQMQSENSSYRAHTPQSSRKEVSSRQSNQALKEKDEMINKLKFQLASAKNYNHYMENMQRNYSKKYETLGSLLADYLENLLYSKEAEETSQGKEITLNLHELKTKDIKQWKLQEMEAVIHLLITQLKPFISKNSLTTFPEVKNINISFIEEQPKQLISLPKIADNYEKSYEKQSKKGQNRFKDIPIDISTKILRSNLREWGSKIKHGNMPMVKKLKSHSIAQQNQKSFL